MRTEHFQPTLEGEGRLLLLIASFSRGARVLEGRTKLAKLDFFLRYPAYLRRALQVRRPGAVETVDVADPSDFDATMVRYRYGPWDPAYYSLLGRLIGKGLVAPVPYVRGIGYKATERGQEIARRLSNEPAWADVASRLSILRRHFDLSGTSLKEFIYENFPEVARASWGDQL